MGAVSILELAANSGSSRMLQALSNAVKKLLLLISGYLFFLTFAGDLLDYNNYV